ncbi:MAG: hypothetical protein J6T10_22675 [Methanobrevibacter sp.]|nr:hypothetical protein [Methanobrevibacter sp.]
MNSVISKLKIVLREKDCPFFSDDELLFHYEDNGKDFNKTAYRCLILKSENTTLNLSGFETGDTSKYFRRLAQKYRTNNSGILNGE